MNVEKYVEKKNDGLAEIVTAGGGYAIAFKKWDSETGEAKEPEIQALSLDELNEKKKKLQDEIADIDEVISDINSLTK